MMAAEAAKKNAASYRADIPPEVAPARHLLEHYSGIAPEDVDAHIFAIVRRALLAVSQHSACS